jgi:two-component system heavy metal sensor histidine kinase CusS
MFLKSVEDAVNRKIASFFARPWSLTGRLTAHYIFSTFVVVTFSILILYWGLVEILNNQSRQYLLDEENVIRKILLQPDHEDLLESEIEFEHGAKQNVKHYARILVNDQTHLATPLMDVDLPASLFPPPRTERESPGFRPQSVSRNGKTYLIDSLWVDVTGDGTAQRVLQVALDVTNMRGVLANFRFMSIAITLFGVLASFGAGTLIIYNGMLPLREIAEKTRRVTAANLDEHILTPHWPEEIKELAVAFDRMLDRLRDAFERLSCYSANLAHELRTPIFNLMGESEVALTKERTAEEFRKIIESNIEEFERLSQMVDGLLFLSRTDLKNTPLNRVELDAYAEIEHVMGYYQPVAEEKGLEFTCQGEARLQADPVLFRRALSNIISNAIHYTPPGGEVHISISQAADRSVLVSVSDTGWGMNPDELLRIFDRFYRIDGTRNMNPGGSGLGLSIVRSIMDLHGGMISMQSRPGEGTTVTLSFPFPTI